MDRSLIKPNQCRAFGMQICDNPTDPNREMGFYTEDVFIPIGINVSVSTLSMRTPTLEALNTCTYIDMSDEDNLNPTKETFNIFSSEIKMIMLIPTLIQKIINTVRISYLTNEQHHKCTPESLARKWTIITKTTSNTIKTTTKLYVGSAIIPLNKL